MSVGDIWKWFCVPRTGACVIPTVPESSLPRVMGNFAVGFISKYTHKATWEQSMGHFSTGRREKFQKQFRKHKSHQCLLSTPLLLPGVFLLLHCYKICVSHSVIIILCFPIILFFQISLERLYARRQEILSQEYIFMQFSQQDTSHPGIGQTDCELLNF